MGGRTISDINKRVISLKKHDYIKEMLGKSGIDFKNIQKEEILASCNEYKCKIDKNNLAIAIQVIEELCDGVGDKEAEKAYLRV